MGPLATAGWLAMGALTFAAQVVYLNFDGGELYSGPSDDARINQTQVSDFVGTFPAYGEGGIDAIAEMVRAAWRPFDVEVVLERPADGDYTMAMIGAPTGVPLWGLGPYDCFNQNPNNIVYVFHGGGKNIDASHTASTIVHEVGHSVGLEHVNNDWDPMSYAYIPNTIFRDECVEIFKNEGTSSVSICPEQRLEFCDDDLEENTFAEVLELFGPGEPDVSAPDVWVVEPDAGWPRPHERFTLEIAAEDDILIDRVTLLIDGEPSGLAGISPYQFLFAEGLEPGVYEFSAVANDFAGNETESDIVVAHIGVTEEEAEGDDGGCTCATIPAARDAIVLFLLAVAPCRRRRDVP